MKNKTKIYFSAQKKRIVWLFIVLLFVVDCLSGCISCEESIEQQANVSPLIEQWRTYVTEYASLYEVGEYVELLLAMIAQESGGDSSRYPDIMQSSESAGLPPNSIRDPVESIRQGISYFSSLVRRGKELGVCDKTILQSYNFGGAYISFVQMQYGGVHTEEAANHFSQMMAERLGWNRYGDVKYVEHVYSHMTLKGTTDTVYGYEAMYATMLEYEGVPYVFGGDSIHGIDCSAMTRKIYQAAGITLPRTAQEQYDATIHITESQAKAGDLIFFTGTYNAGRYITHVGVYVGENRFFHAGGNRCQFSSLTGYYREHFVCFGRK